jgi:hypothetical protein
MRGDGERVVLRQLALALDHLRHIGAIDELHDDVELAFGRFAKVVHMHNRRVIHLRHRARLVLEALDELHVVFPGLRREDFDGDDAIQ